MLILRCSRCRKKIWRYDKIGEGEVLRCHKHRINKDYGNTISYKDRLMCICGNDIGIDKGTHFKMIAKSFTYSGTKRNP